MKKLIIFMLILCIGISFIGCTKKSDSKVNNAKAPSKINNIVEAKPETTKTFIQSLDKLSYKYKTSQINNTNTMGNIEFICGDLTRISIGEDTINVYEYPDNEQMEKDSTTISSDGSMIKNAIYDWKSAPHFYKNGRILATYCGDNLKLIDTLKKLMGPQFAGM